MICLGLANIHCSLLQLNLALKRANKETKRFITDQNVLKLETPVHAILRKVRQDTLVYSFCDYKAAVSSLQILLAFSAKGLQTRRKVRNTCTTAVTLCTIKKKNLIC